MAGGTLLKNLLKTVGLIILSMGGAGAIIMSVSSFLANKIATRLEQKYKLRIDKELEAYKAGLTQRSYVTKVQFDIEFEVYRKLSKGMFEFISTLYTTIEEKHYPKKEGENHQEKVAEEIRTYTEMVDKAATLQELLYENAAFIPQNIYEKYKKIIELTTTQFWNYQQRFKDYLDGKISLAERVTDSDKQSFETIEKNVEALNNELREHLQKIYIVT